MAKIAIPRKPADFNPNTTDLNRIHHRIGDYVDRIQEEDAVADEEEYAAYDLENQKKSILRVLTIVVIVLLLGTLLHDAMDKLSSSTQTSFSAPGNFKVLSVYKGEVQGIDLTTGKRVSIKNDLLLQKCLAGEIKSGDIVNANP